MEYRQTRSSYPQLSQLQHQLSLHLLQLLDDHCRIHGEWLGRTLPIPLFALLRGFFYKIHYSPQPWKSQHTVLSSTVFLHTWLLLVPSQRAPYQERYLNSQALEYHLLYKEVLSLYPLLFSH